MEKWEIRPPTAIPQPPEPMVTKIGVGDDVGKLWTPPSVQNFITVWWRVFAPRPGVQQCIQSDLASQLWGFCLQPNICTDFYNQ